MITATLTLTRTLDDGAIGYRKYFLIADFVAVRGQGKASIVQLSTGAPMPETDQLSVLGGEQEALMAAADLVRSLPDNESYTVLVNLEPSA